MTTNATSVEDYLVDNWESIVFTGVRIVIILIVALILVRIVRIAVRRLALRAAKRHEKRASRGEAECGTEPSGLREQFMDILPGAERDARAAQRAKTLGGTASSVFAIIIWFIAFLLCLSELNINLAPILAGAGIAGVALGFGAQSLVKDYLSGIFIVIEDQYGVGDIVNVGDAQGVVEEVTLRATRIRSLDGTMWHVPNGEIRRAANMSQYWARVILDVPIAYDADIDAASALIKQVADSIWHDHETTDILEEPELWGVEDFGNDSIAIRLAVKTLPATQWAVARELRAKIKQAFDREGFEIPFPQRTVWLRSEPQDNKNDPT